MLRFFALLVAFLCFQSTSVFAQEVCGTEPSPAARAYLDATRKAAQAYVRPTTRGKNGAMIEVPVQAHIFNDDNGFGGLSLTSYQVGLADANEDYAPMGIRFVDCAAPRYYDDGDRFDFNRLDDEAFVRTAYAIPEVINIFVADEVSTGTSDVCGYTYLPPGRDLILMDADCFNNGATLSHEIGHYLGLYHTHGKSNCEDLTDELVDGSNCDFTGDDICDTPADPNLRGPGCSASEIGGNCQYTGTRRDANGAAYQPLTDNIMSYAPSFCRDAFTNGQYDRMDFYLNESRSYLVCSDYSPPQNDFCVDALPINCGETKTGSITGASIDQSPEFCGRVNTGATRGVWYRYAGDGSQITARLCDGELFGHLAVFTGACDDLVCINLPGDRCSNQQAPGSFATFPTEAGTDYYLYVTGIDESVGNYELEISCVSANCPAPADVRVTERNHNYLIVDWTPDQTNEFELRVGAVFGNEGVIYTNPTPPFRIEVEEACGLEFIEYRGICDNVFGLWSEPIIVDPSPVCTDDYCASYGRPEAYAIGRVQIANIQRSTGVDNGYLFYQAETMQLERGTNYPFVVGPVENGDQAASWRIYLDLNGDNDFEDEGELIFSRDANATQTEIGEFTMPVARYNGPSRLRVILSGDPNRDDCTATGDAETEDYLVNISGGMPQANELCEGAIELSCGTTTQGRVEAAGFTFDVDENCGFNGSQEPGLWYYWPGQDGQLSLDLTPDVGFMQLDVFSGSCGSFTCEQPFTRGTGDGVQATYLTDPDKDYYIYVGGNTRNDRPFTLTLDCEGCISPEVFFDGETGFNYFSLAWDGQEQILADARVRPVGSDEDWVIFADASNNVISGLAPCTDFEVQLRPICTGDATWGESEFISTLGCGEEYCPSYGASEPYWISSVMVGDVNQVSGAAYGYTQFQPTLAQFGPGDDYPVNLQAATDLSTTDQPLNWRVYLDLNRNNSFEDNELLVTAQNAADQAVISSITIPATVTTGPSRLRVMMSPEAINGPCQTGGDLVVEDYSVSFLSLVAPNDLCSQAIPIGCDQLIEGSTLRAASTLSDTECGHVDGSPPGVWYSFVGTGRPMTPNLCWESNYNTRMAVFSGDVCGELTCVGVNSNACGEASSVTVSTEVDAIYYVYVYGSQEERGNFTLNLRCGLRCIRSQTDRLCTGLRQTVVDPDLPLTYDFTPLRSSGNGIRDWLVNSRPLPSVAGASLQTNGSLRITFPRSGEYQICYSEAADNLGCADYCCATYCITDEHTESRQSIVRPSADGSGIDLVFAANGTSRIQWYRLNDDNSTRLLNSGQTAFVPYTNDDCGAPECYYVSYFRGNTCYESEYVVVDNCNPSNCEGDITVEFQGGDIFRVTVPGDRNDVRWTVNEEEAGRFNSIFIPVPFGTSARVCVSRNRDGNGFTTCCTTLENTSSTSFQDDPTRLQIVPNPNSGVFTLRGLPANQAELTVALFDMRGRRMQSWEGKQSGPYETQGLPSGAYVLKVSSEGQTIVKRLVIR
ncbi:zinc-dependent metalloprotease [Lewinella sp. 4G2]|uniref:zinc-dependent metalloprotease n=1 Tax=Lewinella sp. 4G2 TaxID=1803372 RepID=UPI0007B46F29|nr:zinc-dependent metalloprotease [Lewinella sp. 4G2]OAV44596.1 hypothetical protein A3850_008870 [Lewinella sp. 4G2]